MTRMEDFDDLFFNMADGAAMDDSAGIRSSSSSMSSEDDVGSDSSGLSVSSSNDSDDNDECLKKRCDDHDDDNDGDDGKENKMPSAAAATSCSGDTVANDGSKSDHSHPNSLLLLEDNSILSFDAAASLAANKKKKNEADGDDDDLVEMFSRSSPIHNSVNDYKAVTVSRTWKKKRPLSLLHHYEEHDKPLSDRCVGDNDDGNEDGEQQPLSPPMPMAARHHDFDSLDKDALAELDEDDSIHEEVGGTGGGVVDDEATISMDDNFIITYNCEKKECTVVDEEIIDSSDDDNDDEDYVDFENILSRRKNVVRSIDDVDDYDDSPQHQRDQSNANGVENIVDSENIIDLMEKSRSSSPTSSLDSPREMESPSCDPSPPPPSSSPRLSAHEKKTCNLQPTIRSVLAKSTNPYQSKPKAIPTRQDKDKNSPLQPKNTRLLDIPEEELSLESPSALLPRSSTNHVTVSVSNNSTTDAANTSATRVVTLPDIGLNPDVHMSELHRFGIDHSHTAPPPCIPHPDKIIHKFNNQNRPHQSRRNIAVDKVFSSPVNNLWKKSNKFHSFNHLQSEMVNVLANSDDNVIVSAPTGAGKTVLFEMAMARLLASNIHRRGGGGGVTVSKAQKILYLAPNKALCEERQLDWSKRLVNIDRGIICTTITGGVNTTSPSTSFADIASSHLIITTAEKWDSITRRWNEQFVLLSSIKLVLVDEVHMIGEPDRGVCLESVICRMKTIHRVARSRMLTGLDIASSR